MDLEPKRFRSRPTETGDRREELVHTIALLLGLGLLLATAVGA